MMRTASTRDTSLLRPLREACLRAVADRQLEPGDTPLCSMCVEVSLIVRASSVAISYAGLSEKNATTGTGSRTAKKST
jgi:hypothetical protein